MKKIFLKILILVILVGVINGLLRNFYYNRIIPYYWGDEMIAQKRNYLHEIKDSVNLLMIGSSKILSQVKPKLFDSVLNIQAQNIHSFNFGVTGMFPPESFYLLDHLLNTDSLKPEYILFELTWPKIIDLPNLHTRRSYYWLNLNYTIFSGKVILESRNSMGVKLWNTTTKAINLIEKEYNINLFEEYFKYKSGERDGTRMNEDSLRKQYGFRPLKFPRRPFGKPELKILEETKTGSINAFTKNAGGAKQKYSRVYLKTLNQLITLAEERKIHLIFILPSLWKNYQYDEMVPLFQQIDYKHKIILGDYLKYPEFFSIKNLSNSSHLSPIGAELYTKELAARFLELKKILSPFDK
ncbi:MAG: hypothetical protein ABIN97_10990 [Ginsengibacter sp.]